MDLEADKSSSALSESEILDEEREQMLLERAERQKRREEIAEKKRKDVCIGLLFTQTV